METSATFSIASDKNPAKNANSIAATPRWSDHIVLVLRANLIAMVIDVEFLNRNAFSCLTRQALLFRE
jgi:hypothetical protein